MADLYEIARLFFAGISAAASAIGVWQKFRDNKKAAKTFDEKFHEVKHSKEAEEAAMELADIAPPEVIAELEMRADTCWTSYRNVLGGEYLPDEIDKATLYVQACVCRELGRIYKLNGGEIPDRWKPQWETYNCENKKSTGIKFNLSKKS